MTNEHVYWSIDLMVDCPDCGENFDANLIDDFAEDNLKGVQICEAKKDCSTYCPKCDHEFTFDIQGGT